MQGFIHLLLEAYVSDTIGSQHLQEIRQKAGVSGPPLAAQYYPDASTLKLLHSIAAYQGIDPDEALYRLGVYFINAPLTERIYAAFLEGHHSARELLEHLPMIFHTLGASPSEARTLEMRLIAHDANLHEIIYTSPRRLCRFLLGVLDGIGHRFHEPLEAREVECQERGALACRILVRFLAAPRSGPMPFYPSSTATSPRPPSGPMAPHPSPSASSAAPEPSSAPGSARKREQELDILVLQVLAGFQPGQRIPSRPAAGNAQQPLGLMLSLFDIANRLTESGFSGEQVRFSLIQRSLSRLAAQGFVESKLDPQAYQQGNTHDPLAFGGGGVLAAQRYRITSAGRAWLQEMQHKQNR